MRTVANLQRLKRDVEAGSDLMNALPHCCNVPEELENVQAALKSAIPEHVREKGVVHYASLLNGNQKIVLTWVRRTIKHQQNLARTYYERDRLNAQQNG